jgi:hypothetical protein
MNGCRRKFRRRRFLLWGSLGNLGSLSTGNFRDSWKAPEREHLFFVGALLGGSSLWIRKRAPGMDTILQLEFHSPGTLRISCKRGLWERGIPLYGAPSGRLLCPGP